MNHKPTAADNYREIMIVKTEQGHMRETLQEIKHKLAEHCKEHKRTWYWIVPTLLLVLQFILNMAGIRW
jgi:hypothetical protein